MLCWLLLSRGMKTGVFGHIRDQTMPANPQGLIITLQNYSQQAHDVYSTSYQRRCNVMTLHRRWGDVV